MTEEASKEDGVLPSTDLQARPDEDRKEVNASTGSLGKALTIAEHKTGRSNTDFLLDSGQTLPSQNDLKIRPGYVKLVPRPGIAELKALEISLLRDGQREPIVVNEQGIVVDGHSRFRILKKHGLPVQLRVVHFDSEKEERDYILKSALARRNLSDFQKIKMAQPRLKEERRAAASRKRTGKKGTFAPYGAKVGKRRRAMAIVAEEFGISEKSLERGSYVLTFGTPKQHSDIDRKLATINGVYNVLRARMKKVQKAQAENEDTQKMRYSTKEISSRSPEMGDGGKEEDLGDGKKKEVVSPIDKDAVCYVCNSHLPRGDLKLTSALMCKNCRKKLGMRY